jgi:hypothetical protein
MSEPAPQLTAEQEQTVRASGSAWCSEETFAKLLATIDATRRKLQRAEADRDRLALTLRRIATDFWGGEGMPEDNAAIAHWLTEAGYGEGQEFAKKQEES